VKEILTVENMRKSDAYTIENKNVSGAELMMRAAKGIFASVQWKSPVAIVCGSGNNAGDGYALAILLKEANIDCTLVLLKEKFSTDGKYYYNQCKDLKINTIIWEESVKLSDYKIIVDCLLGTGFSGELRKDMEVVIQAINNSGAYVVSVDINSGLNGDTGLTKSCILSDITVSVGSFQTGHFLNMAKDVMKTKVNCPIGIEPVDPPYKLIEKEDVGRLFKSRKNHSNKGTYGYIALIGGSMRYSGAIRLAYMANAAMRSGAGVVKVGIAKTLVHDVTPHILESTVFPLTDNEGSIVFVENEVAELVANVKTVAFGMGIGVTENTADVLKYLLRNYKGKLIIDADGLTLLSQMDRSVLRNASCRVILTPHIKEFSRLTDTDIKTIQSNSIEMAQKYAADNDVILLLKGPATIITDGNEVYITETGCAGMATAGSGDVLSGILSAVCAYIEDDMEAVAAAAYINGKAGEYAQEEFGDVSMLAGDTVANIARVIKNL